MSWFKDSGNPEYHESRDRERKYSAVENSGSKQERKEWIKLQANIAKDKARDKGKGKK